MVWQVDKSMISFDHDAIVEITTKRNNNFNVKILRAYFSEGFPVLVTKDTNTKRQREFRADNILAIKLPNGNVINDGFHFIQNLK